MLDQNDMTPLDRLAASRRRFLALAGAGAGTLGLAACAGGGGGDDEATGGAVEGGGEKTDTNPCGITESTVDVVIFDGGFGDQYAIDAGKAFDELHKDDGFTAEVSSTVNIQPELQPRFVGGTPPDLFDNSGAQSMNTEALVNEGQLAELDALLEAPSLDLDGTVGDNLLAGATDPGMFSGKFLALNYVYSVFALWYSGSQFEKEGWTPPTTWDELMELGEKVLAKDIYMFSYGGQNAADYYQEMALSMAIKEGGTDVQKNLDKLEADAFDQDAIVTAYAAIEEAVKAGFFEPGGEGIKHTQAQTNWVTGKSLMYPSGSWIENEQRDVTPEGYEMMAAPTPLLSSSAQLPLEAIHGTAGEPFMVPAKGKNPAGGLEFLRVMLSKEQAMNFTTLTGSPTIVKGADPDPADSSAALNSVLQMISDAGDNTFHWHFAEWYGLGPDIKSLWTEFLSGKIGADETRERSQKLIDKIRDDDSIDKFDVA
jgi:N-acetylglucosamine transport system substrate-binding protein